MRPDNMPRPVDLGDFTVSMYGTSEAAMRAQIAAQTAEIERLSGEVERLSETWMDEREVTWRPPTAWAYAQVCRVMHEQRTRAEKAESELDELRPIAERLAAYADTHHDGDTTTRMMMDAWERVVAGAK